jgi:hypothetical protein
MLIASYTKSGGSWLTWMLIDIIHKPDFNCDQVAKATLDKLIHKTEIPQIANPDIHIFRHPLDVVCSAYNYCLFTNKPVPSLHEYIDHYLTNDNLLNLQTVKYKIMFNYGKKAPIQIKYEDLLENTKQELCKIVESNNIDKTIEKYSLDNCKKREKTIDPVKMQRDINKNYTFFNKATKYYYKEQFTTEQIQKGHNVFADIIEQHWPDSIEEKI